VNIRLIIFFIWIFQMGGYAQLSSAFSEYKQRELWKNNSNEKTLLTPQYVFTETAASTWFDVTYYRLELKVLTQPNFLKGKVTITGICRTGNALTLTFDLMDNMSVDSVLVNSQARSFIKQSNSFVISLSHPSTSGEVLSIDIFYEGLPVPTGFGSFIFGSHNSIPWVYSLSEPYGAKDWWPCKDDPSDKADSADIIITCDSTLKVGSQGILVSVTDNGDGTATHYWKERYPIASYLISVAITNYVQFSNWFRYSDTDSMEILNYVLPEHYSDALQNLPHVVDMLEIYSGLLGMYPFIEEKYGHAEFSGGGAMEHQTMTSTVTFNEDVISHELAHQWFGDMITCQTWADLWLNEGFAEYCSALYRERQYGISSYWAYMNIRFDQAKLANGVIGIPDLSNVRSLFNPNRMYSKGASVLHMLRHVLGDSTFFRSIYAYANNPALKFHTFFKNGFTVKVSRSITTRGHGICRTIYLPSS
jgi:aminopeptidase N